MEKQHEWGKAKHTEIAVVGLGYVGLPLALLFVKKGFKVLGIDFDSDKLNLLQKGNSYLPDIENNEVQSAFSTNRFHVTNNYMFVESVDVIVICVPTPLSINHTPDLNYLQYAGKTLSKHIKKGQLVIIESTTYPGTTEEVLLPLLEQSNLKVGKDIFLGYSPERIDPGNKHFNVEQIPKVLSGVTQDCAKKAYEIYSQVFTKLVLVSSTQAAELTKLLENCYRFINISFINEFAKICDAMDINIWEVIDAANTKPYGFSAFYPGPGIGGHCIPVDPLYLQWKAKQYGIESDFIKLSDKINQQMPQYIVEQVRKRVSNGKQLKRSNVLIYGVAYKRDINDVRESTSLEVISLLQIEGANVSYHDPFVPSIQLEDDCLKSVAITDETLNQQDCIIILTDHSIIPVQQILDQSKLVVDIRNVTKGLKGKAIVYRLGGGNT